MTYLSPRETIYPRLSRGRPIFNSRRAEILNERNNLYVERQVTYGNQSFSITKACLTSQYDTHRGAHCGSSETTIVTRNDFQQNRFLYNRKAAAILLIPPEMNLQAREWQDNT
ncbi:hypothetical protein PV325_010252 [Microctonus aethiopoides]|uniref:Uncharacterized protein n=1 Tax=Microctonus aethiopoides TaxID=144406 RepID=A0AA39C3A7_9HYME|nr:hypothetical protein PV325_010252 [Microctonus aethiopoides]KAK0074746.1 hypothetical protein PV326_012199 [Microctonus aethiopoides]KAK0157083.1 hypothetical protein PV328_011920 [Microctonus aethiopoides]